jgi:PRTRC genetic system protein B
MDVGIAIGENHRFELHEALLVYRSTNNRTFITRHDVTAQEDGPPMLGAAHPLTTAFVKSLVRSLGGETDAEVLPDNVLARTERVLCWWTQAQRRQMFYESAEGKCAALNGGMFSQPPLVWRAADGQLKVRALVENQRPAAGTKLAVAPYWNLSDRSAPVRCAGPPGCLRPRSRRGSEVLRERLYARQRGQDHAASRGLRRTVGEPRWKADTLSSSVTHRPAPDPGAVRIRGEVLICGLSTHSRSASSNGAPSTS